VATKDQTVILKCNKCATIATVNLICVICGVLFVFFSGKLEDLYFSVSAGPGVVLGFPPCG